MAPPALEISPYALRAPEVIVGAKFDTMVDVWALGCFVRHTVQFLKCFFLCLDIQTADRALAF